MNLIPPSGQNVLDRLGDVGREWAAHLPDALADFCRAHCLTIEGSMPGSYCPLWKAVDQSGSPFVIKALLPDSDQASALEALPTMNGLLPTVATDDRSGLVAMPLAVPGTTLEQRLLDDRQATVILATCASRLKTEPPTHHQCRPLTEIAAVFDRTWASVPTDGREAVDLARATFDQLLATTTEQSLLHGDLHHGNVLRHHDEWVVIDPKGFVGDPASEIAALLGNPSSLTEQLQIEPSIWQQRIETYADVTGHPAERLRDWAFAQGVVRALWSLEDNEPWRGSLAEAVLISNLEL